MGRVIKKASSNIEVLPPGEKWFNNTSLRVNDIAYDEVNQKYIMLNNTTAIAWYTTTSSETWASVSIPDIYRHMCYAEDTIIMGYGTTSTTTVAIGQTVSTMKVVATLPIYILDIIYEKSKNIIVAVGGNSKICYSKDKGMSWVSVSMSIAYTTITYDGTKFVALCATKIATSTDGITWIETTYSHNFRSLQYGDGKYVAISYTSHKVMSSTDLVTWVEHDTPLVPYYNYTSIGHLNGIFAIAGNDPGIIMISRDLINWEVKTVTSQTGTALTNNFTNIKAVNGKFFAYSMLSGTMAESPEVIIDRDDITKRSVLSFNKNIPNGFVWRPIESGETILRDIAYGDGIFVAVGGSATNNSVLRSIDGGKTWTVITTPTTNNWYTVCYAKGLFVALSITGTGNRAMTSPDGINWTVRATPADNQWSDICYAKGLFVAVAYSGDSNRVMTSPDGITWTARASAANNYWYSICYGNGLFVAISNLGSANGIMTSPDGITWTSRTPISSDSQWSSVCFGNGLFVAVANSGTNRVMTSPDGINWTLRSAANDNYWNSVCYSNGLFVAVAYNYSTYQYDRVMVSTNGINWSGRVVRDSNTWVKVRGFDSKFIAVASTGDNNKIMISVGTALSYSRTKINVLL